MRKRTKRLIGRHLVAGLISAFAFGAFFASRPSWVLEMRTWKAFGDAALILLLITLAIGPLAKLHRPWARSLPWRRETGIWFGLMAIVHTILILNGWARWSFSRLFGYEYVEQLGREARLEPGFGLANLMGLVAIFWTLVLVATSSDRAVRFLGGSAWRWLHTSTYVVFYLSLIHAGYFLFIHFTLSFHKQPPAPDWFRVPFLTLGAVVIMLQAAAFRRTVAEDRRKGAASGRRRTPARVG